MPLAAPLGGSQATGHSASGFHMGAGHGTHGHFLHHRRFARGFGFGPYYGDDYDWAYDDNGCYQLRHVHTSHGWRWLRAWTCS
jgi:hypothetical protein